MKNVAVAVFCLFIAFFSLGCQNTQSRAVEGTVIGGLLGAAGGGIIGHQSGHGGEGAAIGAAAGALTGAVVGSQIKKPGQAAEQPAQAQASSGATGQLYIQQIVDMSKQGVSDSVIIDRIHATNSRFVLTPKDIDYLKGQGVNQKVIDAMQGK